MSRLYSIVAVATMVLLTGAAADLQEYKEAYSAAAKIEEYGEKVKESLNIIGGFQPPCGLKVIPTAYPYMAFKDDKDAISKVFQGTDVAESGSWTEVGPGDFRALIYGIHELGENWFERVKVVADLAQKPADYALKVHEETHAWEGAVEKVGETWEDWENHKGDENLKTAIASRVLAVLGLVVSENWRAIFNEVNKAAQIAENVGRVTIPAGVYGNDSPIELDFSKCESPEDVVNVIKAAFGDLTPDRVIELIDSEAKYFGLGDKFVENYMEGGQYQPHEGGFTVDEMKDVIEKFKSGKDIYGQELSEEALAFAILFNIEDVWATYEEYVHQYGHFFPPAESDLKLACDKIEENAKIVEDVLNKLNAWADVGITKAEFESNPLECAPAVKDWAVGELFGVVEKLEKRKIPLSPVVVLAGLLAALAVLRRR
ncbi:hypothetical protein [Methanopyrus kandleri]|uniref:Predicted Zn-dependent metallopeptidase n=2 Tax=Methanopyrus kandleri TaxID=2320 RepID=Q8TXZ7_METKA|nr:hypothetical protein [Methanopyrus kandleri]AAM01725.1 Predicted Zn-dependent metallopeptidase [Methanopyrus kandleri AV19]HII70329.1 hypothetical protein [Methanopyrus kandleri]